ncbi:MAG TPA: hypothetical protein PLD25_27880 [Chloroflexota bacterium]|nr:hypothetical protein [Chloroflexota bacterium]HUM71082.1 hypothetical protein [Chloroflexota bacterium]
MSTTIDISHEPDLGYVFHPANGCFGGTRFDVIMRALPTQRHYDPEKVQATIVRQSGTETVHLHCTASPGQYRLCPGRIVLTDRVGKQVAAFCFGGELHIIHQPSETICVFQSPAPIVDLTVYHSANALFANEVEILLAQRRAAWNPQQPHRFEQHMAQVDPAVLYAACLEALAAKFATFPHLGDPVHHQFVHNIQQEITDWQQDGRWPSAVPNLAELL